MRLICKDCIHKNEDCVTTHDDRCDNFDSIRISPEIKKQFRRQTPYERTRAAVYATGNKWAIENFNATH